MSLVLGADGWRDGWVAAVVDLSQRPLRVTWHDVPDARTLLGLPAEVAAVDIPMGLAARAPRGCDVAARLLLGPARSSVFDALPRAILHCATYGDARALLRARGERLVSAQAFGLVGKTRDMDAALTPSTQDRVVEAHPEISFRRLAGTMVLPSKKTAAGAGARIAALRSWLPGVVDVLSDAPARVPVDDALDALACAWTASRSTRVGGPGWELLGGDECDEQGLRMQIVDPSR